MQKVNLQQFELHKNYDFSLWNLNSNELVFLCAFFNEQEQVLETPHTQLFKHVRKHRPYPVSSCSVLVPPEARYLAVQAVESDADLETAARLIKELLANPLLHTVASTATVAWGSPVAATVGLPLVCGLLQVLAFALARAGEEDRIAYWVLDLSRISDLPNTQTIAKADVLSVTLAFD
jgi:hypothetical protein